MRRRGDAAVRRLRVPARVRNKALHGGRLSLSIAQPLHPGMMPPGCGVHEFEAKPSFCFDKTLSAFDGIAHDMAEDRLQDPNLNETFSTGG